MKKLFVLILFAATFVSCSMPKTNGRRIITVSIEPLRFFAEQIAGDKFEVKTMVPKGNNPETYEPTAQQMVDLALSDIYIKVGNIGFERTWMKKLELNAPHTIIIDSSDGIVPAKSINGISDPHTWMSCLNAITIAKNIYHSLAEIDSKDSIYFKQNLENLVIKIEETDTKIRGNLTKDKNPSFLIYHPALTYYAIEYGLTQIPIEEEGREPSATQLKNIITLAKAKKVKTIFVQKEFSNRNSKMVAESVGAKEEEINPLNYDWDKEMVKISESLR
jgi:zinc transport system substrate-binding protein